MTTVPDRGFGSVPFGRGLFGRAATVDTVEAEIDPLHIDMDTQSLGGTSGVSAAVTVADIDIVGSELKAGIVRQLPDYVEWSAP